MEIMLNLRSTVWIIEKVVSLQKLCCMMNGKKLDIYATLFPLFGDSVTLGVFGLQAIYTLADMPEVIEKIKRQRVRIKTIIQ